MSKFSFYLMAGMLGAMLVTATTGCSNSPDQSNISKAAFYGTPPSQSEQAQIAAHNQAQAKAMAGAYVNKPKQ